MLVYLITNTVNGKRYVGQTSRGLKRRWSEHQYSKNCVLLHNAILKYGKNNFVVEPLIEVDAPELANEFEIEYINRYLTKSPSGYNLVDGGLGNINPSLETRKKMSRSAKAFQDKTGQLKAMQKNAASMSGKITGPRHKRNKTGIFAPGMQAFGGTIGGAKQAREKTGMFSEKHLGKGGRTNAASGHLIRLNHRFHQRSSGKINIKCSLCTEINNGSK